MAEYRVVCAKREPCHSAAGRFHVNLVGSGTASYHTRIWTAAEVCDAIDQGDRFYIQSRETGQKIELSCGICPGCNEAFLLTTPAGQPLELDVFGLPELRE
ncbi:MAG TPA: hypothetical protein VFE46_10055 [Pirellulales bacterium]|nr:hypothetical protein [Pirellulales bacterium]